MRLALTGCVLVLCISNFSACGSLELKTTEKSAPALKSLSSLSIEALRKRNYHSHPRIETVLSSPSAPSAYARERGAPISAISSAIASYESDGLRVYARLDAPTSKAPADGYPVVLFLHGYIGIENAPDADLMKHKASYYSDMLEAYASAGFMVITPAYRGHGTVEEIAAEGIEYLRTWDSGSYISPLFYAIDALNLLDGLGSLEHSNWAEFFNAELKLDLNRVYLVGHSQGGDVALTVLAVAGENSAVETPIAAASIWSGCIAPRLTQLKSYFPMQSTPQAFLDGSGRWSASAVSKDGQINPDFVFAYPPEWIQTPHPLEWTWQKDTWKFESVAAALEHKTKHMYETFREKVADLNDVSFELRKTSAGRSEIAHDKRVTAHMAATDSGSFPQYLTEALILQFSDRDLYSPPEWNRNLCVRINKRDGHCTAYTYTGSTHELKISEERWFSPEGTKAGFPLAIARDLSLFNTLPSASTKLLD